MRNKRSATMIKNMLLFFVASFGTKFISFFLTPLYTSLVPSDAYGTLDLMGTIVSLMLPVLMLDISDAIMFFSYKAETPEEKQQPLLLGMRILQISSLVLSVGLLITGIVSNSRNMWIFCLYILLNYFSQALHLNLLAYMRSVDMVNTIVITSIVSSVVSLLLNVVLLLGLRMGLYGFMIASIAGSVAGNLYCLISIKYWKIQKTPFVLNKDQVWQMLRYSIPLIFTGLAWWVNNSLDRFFILHYCGVEVNGIYAVANKIPTLLMAVHSVVYQAMQLSVFAEMKSADSKEYMKKMYSIYNFIMVLAGSVLIVINIPLAQILFKGGYFIAWKYVPIILVSNIVYSVIGYTTIIAAVSSETVMITVGTLSGAAVNALLNFLLIPKWGLYGAIIATLIGYLVIWVVLILKVEKKLDIKFPKIQSLVMYALLILQWVFLMVFENAYLPNCIIVILICLLNIRPIRALLTIAVNLLGTIKNKILPPKKN